MRIPWETGQYVGIGRLDDEHEDNSPEIEKIFAFWARKFRWVNQLGLSGTRFTARHQSAVAQMQANYIADKKLKPEEAPLRGVINKRLKEVSGYLKPEPKVLPITFTQEGHQSNMFIGPCASTASRVEQEQLTHWKPIGDWNTAALPFDKSGPAAWYRQLNSAAIEGPPVDPNNPDGPKVMWPFPPGTPWSAIGFSRGAKDLCDFLEQYVLPKNAPLHWRLKDFRRGMAYGNPRRGRNVIVPWSLKPPSPNTSGIMTNNLFDATKWKFDDGRSFADVWAEEANDEDMFAEVEDNEAGQNQTAIARIITENSWAGGQTAILSRVMKLFGNPLGGAWAAIMAIYDAIKFLATNPNPHYATFATDEDVAWIREGFK